MCVLCCSLLSNSNSRRGMGDIWKGGGSTATLFLCLARLSGKGGAWFVEVQEAKHRLVGDWLFWWRLAWVWEWTFIMKSELICGTDRDWKIFDLLSCGPGIEKEVWWGKYVGSGWRKIQLFPIWVMLGADYAAKLAEHPGYLRVKTERKTLA